MNKNLIISQLTIDEKIKLLQAKDAWTLNGMERFDIPEAVLTDGPNGVRLMSADPSIVNTATAIPTESILSASWDKELLHEVGAMLAEECHDMGVDILLGPGVNAKRSPLAGRNFEYYSEDPYLSGILAAEMIKGVQEKGIGTSLKHYVANDQETRRFTSDAAVDEQTFREMLLAPFEIAIKDAKPWTIMAAYPSFRGEHLCENEYTLKTILRDEFGYEGVALSDWGGITDKVKAHKNGLDLETGSFSSADILKRAIADGIISMADIDEHVFRVLELIEKIVEGRKMEYTCDYDKHHELAQKAAAESIVLLKNENHILPLTKQCEVAVIGKFAKEPRFGGGGSSGVAPKKLDIPFDYLSQLCNSSFAMGYDMEDDNAELIEGACAVSNNKKAVIIFIGTTEVTESEGADRLDIKLPQNQVELVKKVARVNENIIICNASGSAVELAEIEPYAKAILHTGLSGEGCGKAVADIIFGNICPSGKLTESFPVCIENTPTYPYFPGYDNHVVYSERMLQGYRYYDTKKIPVMYPFGYGLSYTNFEYSNLEMSQTNIKNGDSLRVSFDVKNVGDISGAEVVQCYIRDIQSYVERPYKELKGFDRVELQPGETKHIEIVLDERSFAYFAPHLNRFAVESGDFEIMIGASSQDIRLKGIIHFDSEDDVRLPLDWTTSIGVYYNDDRYSGMVRKVFDELGITESHPMFPMLSGMKLEDLAGVLAYIQVPTEQGMKYQEMIYHAID